jgi:hypothetical protein
VLLRPNAPRMVTLVAAVALTLVGLSVTILPIGFVNDVLTSADLQITREQGYWCLLGSPILLVLGSLLPNL